MMLEKEVCVFFSCVGDAIGVSFFYWDSMNSTCVKIVYDNKIIDYLLKNFSEKRSVWSV